MTRIRPTFASLAIFLALLLPLEQSHCAWMAMLSRAPRAANGSHACCRNAAKAAPTTQPNTSCCIQLPDGSLRTQLVSGPSPASTSSVLHSESFVSPSTVSKAAPAPALDVGSPPLPLQLGAHGLRAPPRSA